jgi:cellulose synthase/poly-beta-1,6-N-acetylglucosamine synthase-like glycosyltransferase
MCSLGEERAERAEKRTIEKIIMNMHRNDFTLDQIAVVTDKSKAEVAQIIRRNELVMA